MTTTFDADRVVPTAISVSLPIQSGPRNPRRPGAFSGAETANIHEEHLAGVYRYAVENGGIVAAEPAAAELGLAPHEVDAAIGQLLGRRLLAGEPGAEGLFVAVDPELAALLLVSPMEQEIYRRTELIAQIRERTEAFRKDYARIGRPAAESSGVERVVDAVAVRGCLKLAAEACRQEILVLQSGGAAEVFGDFLRVCGRQPDRGITVRVLGQHRHRADLVSRQKLRSLTEAGAEVRTVSHIPRAAVVFDRSLAILLEPDRAEPSASCVRDDSVVRFLLDLFDHQWEAATPVDCSDSGYAEAADDLQQAIAALMARGFTDEVMARKLGMSVRTCRRHIAALMLELGAVSRFQAGAYAARRQFLEAI